ncbi:hypothetical protein JB92DRAFT_3092667 [Gautieria morchelliformis]|nr:hypothetical protein JB92DRAFT_3092667 [Gautieria morchelliformis]
MLLNAQPNQSQKSRSSISSQNAERQWMYPSCTGTSPAPPPTPTSSPVLASASASGFGFGFGFGFGSAVLLMRGPTARAPAPHTHGVGRRPWLAGWAADDEYSGGVTLRLTVPYSAALLHAGTLLILVNWDSTNAAGSRQTGAEAEAEEASASAAGLATGARRRTENAELCGAGARGGSHLPQRVPSRSLLQIRTRRARARTAAAAAPRAHPRPRQPGSRDVHADRRGGDRDRPQAQGCGAGRWCCTIAVSGVASLRMLCDAGSGAPSRGVPMQRPPAPVAPRNANANLVAEAASAGAGRGRRRRQRCERAGCPESRARRARRGREPWGPGAARLRRCCRLLAHLSAHPGGSATLVFSCATPRPRAPTCCFPAQ